MYVQLRPQNLNQGLTLVECVVAIVITNILLAALAAPLVMVTATRSQNDRINQASGLAISQVDQMRALMEQGVYQNADLPPASSVSAELGQPGGLSMQPPPSSVTTCTGVPATAVTGCLRTFNNAEFVVQVYRGAGITAGGRIIAFPMQVRVYSLRTFDGGNTPSADVPIPQVPATFTASGDSSGLPLIVLTTDVVRGDNPATLCNITDCQ
ncbi:prepilin-type N-terminal cleavage/methylation domain-containing protein [Candidatus Synechococcus calcipolaris G9]|uniref:Prepilin-type N-terminal cleavage/methylation domain-containing protein n=1 Tax=Candidatus Synechococcus calcipolaris G9 TaxID=1497997 RepID=A0ABT6EZC2_9SYNE|nr:prepilin-type N-terminal cleavage/methylation domain-containing protein [Candidatus Synechococcus calcipolaris]MDG2990920.1 prepilin-type N-terminal cleavage/methylation domain-containing protein [Candidatus Synechococcus calcipolaris G9]